MAADPIVQAALDAVKEMTGGAPSITERNATAQVGAQSKSGLTVTMRGSGYMGIDDEPAGSALNPQAQLGLFAKIRKSASWARFVTFAPVTENTGFLDLWSDEGFVMHPSASEGPRKNIPLHKPDVDQKTYTVKTLSGAFGLRLKAIKSAARAGQSVNQLVQSGIAAGIANVLMDIGINGDASLPADTDINKMRRVTDGWFEKIRANGTNFTSQEDGFSYHNGIWAGMLQQLDEAYRTDPGLMWGMPDVLGTRWLTELTATGVSPSNAHPSIVNDLGSALLNAMGAQANPLGKMGVVLPQIETDGFGTEGYSGIAPTSVVDNGDGTLTININTLAGSGVDRSSTGTDGQRYVTVVHVDTGVQETIAVDFATPNNTVTTASLLGQNTASTTAADYVVKWADMTSLFLGLYRYLIMVVQNGIRIYTVFYPHDEVIEVIVHADIDYMVADFDAVSLVDDIIAPRFNIIP